MESLFLHIFNMSITAGWFILAVMILRFILKKAPRWITVLLWGLVGLRLMVPFSFTSIFSLIPSAETVPSDITVAPNPTIQTGFGVVNDVINPIITETLGPGAENSVNPMQAIVLIATVVWVLGVAFMFCYMMFSYLRLRRRVREAVHISDNIWACDYVDTPFILGVIEPRIYLPSVMVQEDLQYVIAHEKNHLRRGDHWWKPLGFLLLSIYWFNPIIWVAYILLCRDIEFACDEKVLAELGTEIKKAYSETLINCSIPRRVLSACPLAFGELNVRKRIRFVLHYRKPAIWIIIAAIAASVAVSVCFLTNPKKDDNWTAIAYTYSICPVEQYGASYGNMVEFGGIPPKANMNRIQALPTVRIDSVAKLNQFKEAMKDRMSFDQVKWDTMSFNEITKSYNDAYFQENTLILVYAVATTNTNRYLPAYVTRYQDTLSIGISETTMGWGDTPARTGWLICISVPNRDVQDLRTIDAKMHDKVFANGIQTLRTYVYVDSNSTRKPAIALQNDGTFSFVFTYYTQDGLFDGTGSYRWLNDKVELTTYDKKYTYRFDVVDGNLVFDADSSSGMVWFLDVVDGAVFKLQ